MPHKFWGVEFPLFQEPKAKAKSLKTPAPQNIQTKGAFYWPQEALPFACATACVQIVLQHSRKARAAYYEAIKALESPGCQDLINEAEVQTPKTNIWSIKTLKKLLEVKAIRKPSWLKAINQFKDNEDVIQFFERISEFIRIGFNSQVDRDNERYKVFAENAPNLFGATVIRIIVEYCEEEPENWSKYTPDKSAHILTSNPTRRSERLKKRDLIQTYKHYKWVLRHDKKLREYADQWYKCRVNPGTIEAYLNETADTSEIDLEGNGVNSV
jgi:hypothetical protein